MGFWLEGFLGVEGRFFYTVMFETVASTASIAFFYRIVSSVTSSLNGRAVCVGMASPPG